MADVLIQAAEKNWLTLASTAEQATFSVPRRWRRKKWEEGVRFVGLRTTFCQVLKLQTTTPETVSPRLANWLLSLFTAGRWNLSVVCLSVSRSMIPSFEEVRRARLHSQTVTFTLHTHTYTHARSRSQWVSLIRYQSNHLPYFGEASFLSLIFHTGFIHVSFSIDPCNIHGSVRSSPQNSWQPENYQKYKTVP